jgi:ubiquinone/menaquinone biosynthesis C-methylase UbiE
MAILPKRINDLNPEIQLNENNLEIVKCLSCGHDSSHFFIKAKDDLSGMPGEFGFVQCDSCNLVYQNPRITLENIPTYYDDDYIAYRKRSDWGILSKFHKRSMEKHDLEKLEIVNKYISLTQSSKCIDLGCAVGSFSALLRKKFFCESWGLDFKDFSEECKKSDVSFIQGTVDTMPSMKGYFDLVTMWHFLEHDYDPLNTLKKTRQILKEGGLAIIEVPRLDSLSYKMFKNKWPGLQAPQHTALYSQTTLRDIVSRSGLEIIDYLPYGAFPPFFYWYAGAVFSFKNGQGVNFRRHIAPYFISQLISKPFFYLFDKCNLAMQTIICRKESQ